MKQNPFSLYDFLGYFIPGALVLYLYLIIEHLKKVNSFDITALYGFLRTITLLLMILFWYLIFHIGLFSKFSPGSILLLVLLTLVNYVFFMGFMKFYRRYTLEGLMVLAISRTE